jgi:SAM-dependent methyltransferase
MKEDKQLYETFHSQVNPPATLPQIKDGLYHFMFSLLARYLKPEMNVLDVGCGNGVLSLFIATLGCNVLGTDISEAAVEAGRKGAGMYKLSNKAHFSTKLLHELPEEETYDAIVLSEVLEHIPDDAKALRDIHARLKKNGLLIMSVPSRRSLAHRLRMRFKHYDRFDNYVGHVRRYTIDSLTERAKEQGFDIIEARAGEGPLRNLMLTTDRLSPWFYRLAKIKLRKPLEWIDAVLRPIIGEAQVMVVARKHS